MSVFNLSGTGELHCKETGSFVKVELNISPVNGRTRIHCSPLQSSETFAIEDFGGNSSEIALKNVRINSAAGVLTATYPTDVYVNYLTSINKYPPPIITQLTNSPSNEHTLNIDATYLELPSSSLELECETKLNINCYQLMLVGAAQSIKRFETEVTHANQIIRIKSYGNAHPTLAGIIVVEFKNELTDDDKTTLRLSLELYLRQKLSFLAEINYNNVTINLIDHSTVSYSPLTSNDSSASSFKKIKNFVAQTPLYRTYFRFLVELAGNSGVIDDRLLNGFVALEALFGGKKLRKEKVSEKLKVSFDTAELIVELRNKMFHYGESIAETVQIISREKQAHKESPLPRILDQLKDHPKVSFILYSGFTDLMFAHFSELVGIEPLAIKRWCPVDLRQHDWYKNLEFDQ